MFSYGGCGDWTCGSCGTTCGSSSGGDLRLQETEAGPAEGSRGSQGSKGVEKAARGFRYHCGDCGGDDEKPCEIRGGDHRKGASDFPQEKAGPAHLQAAGA